MKKILFLLLFTIASYGQAVFDEGIQITNTESTTATKVNVQEANGKVNTQTIKTGFNKNIGLGGSDVVGANTLLNQYATTPSDWTSQSYVLNSVVFYAGKQWIAKMATATGDVPAVSSKWEEITFEALSNKTVIVDATPTDGSNNAVSSNGVFDALATKAPLAHTHTVSQITDFPTFKTIENQSIIGAGNIDLDKNSVGLGNVDNTSDLNKTISTATQTALNAKANISGQVFTGAVSATNLSGTNTGDNAPNSLYSGLVTNATHTGEVTGSTALTITNGAVTNAKLANVATSTLKGRVTATTGVVEDLTASQVRTLLNVANGANNYVHPANHLASIITQDASNRFVTDTEKSAWNAKEPAIASGTISQYWRGDKTWQEFPTIQTIDNIPTDGSNNAVSSNAVFDALATKSNIGHTHVASQITDLSKASVGLGNVDNTSDLSKPLSTATINALATKAPISSVHNPVTLGTANGLSLSTQQLSLGLASSGVTGALSGTDWNTFNGKFNTPTGLTTNYLPKWNGSGLGNSNIFDNGTNIGIGTTTPTFSKLQIKGDDGKFIGYFYNNSGTAGQVKGVVIEAGTNTSDFALLVNSSQGSPYYKINGNGNSLFGTIQDNLVDRVQVNGTISASPATTANQVPTWGQVQAAARPYKVYTALLTQTLTNAPVATVLENTLGGSVSFSRVSTGIYRISLTGAFTLNKTGFSYTRGITNNALNVTNGIRRVDNDTIEFNSVVNGSFFDGQAVNDTIEIRVYL